MLEITVVGSRHGRVAIYWPGLIAGLVIAGLIACSVVVLFNAAVGFGWSLRPFPFLILPATYVPLLISISRARRMPPEKLRPLPER